MDRPERRGSAVVDSWRWCPHCGAAVQPDWAFCGSCGEVITSSPTRTVDEAPPIWVPPSPQAEPAPQPESGKPRRATMYVAACMLLLLALGMLGYDYQRTVGDLEETQANLSTTEGQLVSTADELNETERSLSDSRSQLAAVRNDLERTAQKLRSARRDMTGLEGTLDSAQDRLDLQANQIQTLQTCLQGVSNALTYVSYSDFGAALAALNAVEVSCQAAYQMF